MTSAASANSVSLTLNGSLRVSSCFNATESMANLFAKVLRHNEANCRKLATRQNDINKERILLRKVRSRGAMCRVWQESHSTSWYLFALPACTNDALVYYKYTTAPCQNALVHKCAPNRRSCHAIPDSQLRKHNERVDISNDAVQRPSIGNSPLHFSRIRILLRFWV